MSKIVVVVPTVRPECHEKFVEAWRPLFEKHKVTLITVWDGEEPRVEITGNQQPHIFRWSEQAGNPWKTHRNLFCTRTDSCRNLGFVAAAQLQPDYLLTLDDDCYPPETCHQESHTYFADGPPTYDPIQDHIDALNRRVPLSWMNSAHDTDLYLRGVPYSVRDEAQVMLSHGVWVGTPDFDGETQLRLETSTKCTNCVTGIIDGHDGKKARACPRCHGTGHGQGVPYSLPYYVGPIPRGVLFPLCGMNVMVRREAIPYLYFAPMGPDAGAFDNGGGRSTVGGITTSSMASLDLVNRFADIWMGVQLKREFDRLNWACVTGYSTILHTRKSDAKKNFEQEKLGRKWNEWVTERGYPVVAEDVTSFTQFQDYWTSHIEKRERFRVLVTDILGKKGGE